MLPQRLKKLERRFFESSDRITGPMLTEMETLVRFSAIFVGGLGVAFSGLLALHFLGVVSSDPIQCVSQLAHETSQAIHAR